MIVYFADRKFNILGLASTSLPSGLSITSDTKAGDVESGISVFECKIEFDSDARAKVEECTEVGNFILRKNDDEEDELYTIIDSEINTKKQTVHIYAEDAGLDLLNSIVGEYEADKEYGIEHYVKMVTQDSGFTIGINEAAGLKRQLTFDKEQNVTARLASIAAAFDSCEVSYNFEIKGLRCIGKTINIYKKRGKDIGETLSLNKEIDNIVISKTIANMATAFRAEGSTPEGADDPVTLSGYVYDDGDFYVDGDTLKSRKALQKWSRYINPDEPNTTEKRDGHIVRLFYYDTTDQAVLCAETIRELQKVCDKEVNYEADILSLPRNVKVGDRVNIVDEGGELFLSTRLLQLERSVVDDEYKAVLGEHLLKKSGISQKVYELAEEFSKTHNKFEKISNDAIKNSRDALVKATTAMENADLASGIAADAELQAGLALETAETTNKQFNELQIDGRNLLLNSGVEHSNNNYGLATYTPSSPLVAGERYTLSMCVTPAAGVTHFVAFVSNGYMGWGGDFVVSGTKKQILKATFTAKYASGKTPDDDITNANVCIYRRPNDGTVTGNSTIHWIKIEKGGKSTDWTLAPEDVASVGDLSNFATVSELGQTVEEANRKFSAFDSRMTETETELSVVSKTAILFPSVSGQYSHNVTVKNAIANSIDNVKIYGKTTQNGTPAPGAPVDMVSYGSLGNVTFSVSDEDFGSLTAIATPNGLPGIPVYHKDSAYAANYTDANGQKRISDEIDLARVVYINRLLFLIFDGTENWSITSKGYFAIGTLTHAPMADFAYDTHYNEGFHLCSHFRSVGYYASLQDGDMFSYGASLGGTIAFVYSACPDIDSWKAYLAAQYAAGTPVTVLARKANPVEIPLEGAPTIPGNPAGNITVRSDGDIFVELSEIASSTSVAKAQQAADSAATQIRQFSAQVPTGNTLSSAVVGTSGNWEYRKWADGRVELWGTHSVASAACSTAMGVMYRTAEIAPDAFPFAVYGAKVVASYEDDDTGAFLWTTTNTTATKPPSYFLVRPVASTLTNGKITIYVSGRWGNDIATS